MQQGNELINHIADLAKRSYSDSVYTFSGFLSLAEQSEIHAAEKELAYAGITFFGGDEGCERQMVRFGSYENFGYEEDFPIVTIVIAPLNSKFADKLTHRDFLGAIMNLGVNRDVIGDILVRENTGYVFCDQKIAGYLSENLDRVKHTSVSCSVSEECPENARPSFEQLEIVVSSNRCDSIIAGLYKMSRSTSQEMFRAGNIFIDGRQCTSLSTPLKEGDTVSARGFGKFIFDGVKAQTGKGRIRVKIRRYV